METRRKQFKKQITYDTDGLAIDKLQHLSKVFFIKKAIIKRVGKKGENRWRLVVEWE